MKVEIIFLVRNTISQLWMNCSSPTAKHLSAVVAVAKSSSSFPLSLPLLHFSPLKIDTVATFKILIFFKSHFKLFYITGVDLDKMISDFCFHSFAFTLVFEQNKIYLQWKCKPHSEKRCRRSKAFRNNDIMLVLVISK